MGHDRRRSGRAGDFALGDVTADVILRSVGVERDFGTTQNHQEVAPVGVDPLEQPLVHDRAGSAPEDPVEPGAQAGATGWGRSVATGLEVAADVPDQAAPMLLCRPSVPHLT